MNPPLSPTTPPASPLKSLAATYLIGIAGSAAAVGVFSLVVRFLQEQHAPRAWYFIGALIYGVAILVVAFLAARTGQRLSRRTCTPAAQRYNRRFFLAMAAYVGTLMGASSVYAGFHPAPWLAWPLALA